MKMIQQVLIAVFVLACLLPFQNCSQPNRFSSNSASSARLSGGEGYGGKLYDLVSNSELCPNSKYKPSEIQVASNKDAFLTKKDCHILNDPMPINVSFDVNEPSVLLYNGQIYRDVSSNAPFAPNTTPFLTLQVEDMPRIPTSGGGLRGEFLYITDNDYASQDVSFPVSGIYTFTVRARSSNTVINSILELRIDGVPISFAQVGPLVGEYLFEANIPSGTRELALAFINDGNTNGEDRNLYLDWVRIAR